MRATLVTGAAGLIGHEVVRQLREVGRPVLAVDLVEDEDVLSCDVRDVHRLYALTRHGLDAVIHCGGLSGPMVARDRPTTMVEVNVLGTMNLLELARHHRARRFVYASTGTYYGDNDKAVIDEANPPRPKTVYAASTAAAECLVTGYAHQHRLDSTIVRLSWVYGPRRKTADVVQQLIADALRGRPTRLEFGTNYSRQYVHVADAARALVLAHELEAEAEPRVRFFNISGGNAATIAEIAKIVRSVLPQADIRLGHEIDPYGDVQGRFDISAAARELGFVPQVSLEQGIKDYTDWLRANDFPILEY